MSSIVTRGMLCVCVSLAVASASALAMEPGEDQFLRGYYLQSHEGDPAGAASAFEKALANGKIPKRLRVEAKERLAQCREDVATRDLARLMPPDVLAYVEIRSPGEHLARLAKTMGLAGDLRGASADRKSAPIPLGNGMFLSPNLTISPLLLRALSRFDGLAVAITTFDQAKGPDGVLVLHPGDSDAVRGLVETVVQVLEPGDPIAGFKTYRLRGQVSLAVTNRLVIASRTREQLSAVIGRLNNAKLDSLATRADFKPLQADRDGALAFVYVNAVQAMHHLGPHLRDRQALAARALLDLDHVKAVSAVLGATETGVRAQIRLDLGEGHRNLAYGLIRTAPISKRSLGRIPAGAAAVAVLGLNPPSDSAGPAGQADAAPRYLTAMDIGREVFANIEEIGLFALGSKKAGGPPIPDVGMVLAVKDSGKSKELWTQLLLLPGLADPSQFQPPREIEVEGRAGTAFQFPNIPPIVLVRLDDRVLVAGTQAAVAAAIRTSANANAITHDAAFKPLLDSLTPDSSKAILIHAGRSLPFLASLAHGHEARELAMAASFLNDLTISLATSETPTQLVVRAVASGLPDIPKIIRSMAGHMPVKHRSDRASQRTVPSIPERAGGRPPVEATGAASGDTPPRSVEVDIHRGWRWVSWAQPQESRLHSMGLDADFPRFTVSDPNLRNTWIRRLKPQLDWQRYPILVLKYRASNVRKTKMDKVTNYLIWVDDGTGPDRGGHILFMASDLVDDGQVHELRKDMRPFKPKGPITTVALGLTCPDKSPALFELVEIRFEAPSDRAAAGDGPDRRVASK